MSRSGVAVESGWHLRHCRHLYPRWGSLACCWCSRYFASILRSPDSCSLGCGRHLQAVPSAPGGVLRGREAEFGKGSGSGSGSALRSGTQVALALGLCHALLYRRRRATSVKLGTLRQSSTTGSPVPGHSPAHEAAKHFLKSSSLSQ